MARRKYRSRQRQNALIQMLAAGGLMLVGLALFLLLRGQPGSTAAQAEAASVVPVAVNFPAPALSLSSMDGSVHALADYRENVLLVNNWATWCPPCKAEMPTLQSYYDTHAQEGFMIVAVEAGDSKENVQPFVESYGLQFQVWLDPKNLSLAAFRNQNLPNSYVIDRAGTVRYAWTGEISRSMLEKYITPLLKQD